MKTVIVEARPSDANGNPVDIRLAGGGRSHYLFKGLADWRAGVVSLPRVQAALGFGKDGFTGGAVAQASAIGFSPAMASTRALMAGLIWNDAAITVSIGDDRDGEPAWTVKLAGTVAGYSNSAGRFVFTLSDMAGRLGEPLVGGSFAGTGGIEGDAEAKGRVKRRSWGRCWNVEGRVLLAAWNIYEFGDPARQLGAFDAVKDKGRPVTIATVAWAGSVAATLEALKAVTVAEGGCAAAPSIGCVKWWTQPSTLTADLRGELGAGYVETVPAIAAAISAAADGPAVDELAALIALRPDPAGLHADQANETPAQMLDRLCLRASLTWAVTADRRIALRPVAFADAVETIAFEDVERRASYPPVAAIKIGWQKNHRVHTDGEISAAVLAGEVVFPDGQKLADLQPAQGGADKTSENTAKDTAAVGGVDAKTILIQLEKIEQIEPIKTDVSVIALVQVDHADELAILDTARIDIEASQRQLDRDAGKLSEATLRLLAEAGHTRRVMRDAGITVDPETGIVRFHALDQVANRTTKAEIELDAQKGQISQKASSEWVNEQIAKAILDPKQVAELEPILKRVANAEILVDGFAGLITSKADVTEVTTIGGRVKTAEQNIDAANTAITNRVEKTTFEGLEKTVQAIEQKLLIDGDTVGLTVNIRQARSVAADAAQGALQGLLAADAADRRQFDQVTQARQELTTRMDAGLLTEATNRLALSVEVASLRAYAVSETTALVKAGEVTARSIEALGASSKQYAVAIGTLNTASITAEGSIVGMRTTIRQVANQAETSDEAMLRALIAGDEASRARQAQLVQVQTETNTQLVANERASAVARETLLVRMGLAEAAIVETRRVLATNNQALVERVSATETVLSDKETGLAATLARLVTEEKANVERGKATAKAIETIDIALNDPKTGVAITVAAIGKAQETLIEDGKTTAKSIETINTSLNDPKTGLSVTVAAIGKAQETLVEDGKTTAKSIETINTTLNDPKTGLAVSVAAIGKAQETLVEDGKSTAKSIESLTTKLGDLGEATVQDLIEAIVTDTGLIKAMRTIAVDINGNIVGYQLVGSKDGPGSFNLINADLSMGTGRVIFDTGTVMKVQGLGFGVNKDLVTWFGPTMPIDKCSRDNGKVWEGTDGKAYWGAGLSAGALHVALQTPDLSADASIVIGPFNTKGGSKVLVVSYAYELTRASTNKGSVTGKPTATIHLDRLDGESWTLVQSFDVTGTTEYEAPSVDGDGYGRQTMGGAITYTDTKAGLGDFTYRARITARALASFNFNSPNAGREIQSLSLSSTEQ